MAHLIQGTELEISERVGLVPAPSHHQADHFSKT
jgi:hypothetical protein